LRVFDSVGQLALTFLLDDQQRFSNQKALNVENEHAHQHRGLDFLDLLCALVDGAQDFSDALEVYLPRGAAHRQQVVLNRGCRQFNPANAVSRLAATALEAEPTGANDIPRR
jgi:hypothetical protein